MADESHVFGGLELNDGEYRKVLAHSFKPAQEKPDLIGGSDAEGVVLARRPRPEALTHEITVRVRQQSTWDAAGAIIAGIVARAAECALRPDGLPHIWTPQGATQGFTAYVLHAQVTEVPISQSDDGAGWGWLDRSPVVKIAVTCKPYWYLGEVEGEPVTSAAPIVVLTVDDVAGDVEAEGRILVEEELGEVRRHLEWGLESRLLDPATEYVIPSDDLVTTGYSGTQSTSAGAVDGDVVSATVSSTVTAICGLPQLGHAGRFKVRARVWTDLDIPPRLRLMYRAGDRALEQTGSRYVRPPVKGFTDVDLGEIVVRPAVVGAQEWTGRIDAYSTDIDGLLEIDELYVLPVERYGIARANHVYVSGVLAIRDDFSGVSGTLNGETALLGGTWATYGATTDWTDGAGLPGHLADIDRATTSDVGPRFGVVGATTYDAIEAQVSYYATSADPDQLFGVLARWVDASNYLRLTHRPSVSRGVWLEKVIGGTPTKIMDMAPIAGGATMPLSTWMRLRLVVFAEGFGRAEWLDDAGNVLDSAVFQDPDLATGGTLDSGLVGIIDYNGSASSGSRSYDAFSASIPNAEPVVMHANKSLQVRHDGVLRENAGDLWGEPWYRGDRCLIPQSGYVGRSTRIAVKVRRDDVEVVANTDTGRAITVQVNYTPRFRMPAQT